MPITRLLLTAALLTLTSPALAQFFSNTANQPPAPAQIPETTAAKTLLDQAAAFEQNNQYEEAVDSVRRVLDTYGEGILQREEASLGGYELFDSVASYTRSQLIDWSREQPEVLEAYRTRVDALADTWFRQAQAEHDPALLRRIVQEAFLSRFADDALLAAGDHALRQGQYHAARRNYMQISPEFYTPQSDSSLLLAGPGSPLWMALRGVDWEQDRELVEKLLAESPAAKVLAVYPDSDLELGGVWFRLVMTSLLEGNRQRAQVEWQLLNLLHADASGNYGSKQGKYVDLAEELIDQAADWPTPPLPHDWTTLAGDSTRSGRQAGTIDLAGPPLWTFPLLPQNGQHDELARGRRRVAERFEKLLSTHPLIVGDLVLYNDLQQVYALGLFDGRPAWREVADDANAAALRAAATIHRPGADQPPVIMPGGQHVGVPRFTLTEHDNHLFTRLGAPVTHNRDSLDESPRGYLVGLDLAAQGKILPGFPLQVDDDRWAFEGAPLVADGKLYVAMRQSQAQSQAYVACFEALGGELRWRTRVCSSQSLVPGSLPEISQNLLTLDDDVLYYNTNQGAVAALSIHDGSPLWIARYPRATLEASRTPNLLYRFRDLTPCVAVGDLVIVAPSDCDRIFALDAANGMLIWETVPGLAADAVHLLGIAQGNLIVSGERLYWIDLLSGKVIGQFPANGNLGDSLARPSPSGYGRGLIAADVIYWPTERHIYQFDAAVPITDEGPRINMRGKIDLVEHGASGGGNLVMAHGVLVIATGDQLIAFRAVGPPKEDVKPELPQ